jgi:hypothetical protein
VSRAVRLLHLDFAGVVFVVGSVRHEGGGHLGNAVKFNTSLTWVRFHVVIALSHTETLTFVPVAFSAVSKRVLL